MTSRPSTAAPILAALAIVLVMLAGYGGAYLLMGERWELLDRDTPGVAAVARLFQQPWLCTMFAPAAWVEEKIIGMPVVLRHTSPHHAAEQAIGMPPTPGVSESSPDSGQP